MKNNKLLKLLVFLFAFGAMLSLHSSLASGLTYKDIPQYDGSSGCYSERPMSLLQDLNMQDYSNGWYGFEL